MGADKAVYVYGILPADIEVVPGTTGVGDPPSAIRVVRHGELAALVSDLDLGQRLGRADDLFVHEEVLDASSADVPVLPLRFGSVMADDDAVAGELLGPHHDEFVAALRELEGRAEYVIRGRYVEQAILREVLGEDPAAARLREELRDADPAATRDQQMELGERVTTAIAAKREADTRILYDTLSAEASASVIRPPSDDLEAACVAFLVDSDQAAGLRRAASRLAAEWRDRIDLRLLGPLAAYDFVGNAAQPADR